MLIAMNRSRIAIRMDDNPQGGGRRTGEKRFLNQLVDRPEIFLVQN
jgi:hypothetical protein